MQGITWFNNICLCPRVKLQSIYYNQIEKYKYNRDNIELFHNNITVNNMTLTKFPDFDKISLLLCSWTYDEVPK